MIVRRFAGLLLCSLVLASCGGGDGGVPAEPDPATGTPPQEAVCSEGAQRESLRSYMDDHYLWPAQAGDAGAERLDAYFQSLLYKPLDRYSYSLPVDPQSLLLVLGKRIGYGYSMTWADTAQTVLKLRTVEPLSPAARAGLGRGDTVLAIDGNSPAQIMSGALSTVSTRGVPREFRLKDAVGEERVVTVVSDEFELSAVPATNTFEVSRPTAQGAQQVKVGYLAYQQFATYGFLEIGTAVQALADAGVQELVLDLRYNGGGSVNIARDVASMVGGERTKGQLFAELRFNSRHTDSNRSLNFATLARALPAPPLQGLSRLVVITSPSTASASELLINGLRPYMPVVLIGDTTYGKPYGFVPRESCGTTFNAVNFEIFNAAGTGGYTAGLTPDCQVPDDLDRQLGDPLEARTRAALYYIANGRCESDSPQSMALRKPALPIGGESLPSGMFLD